MGRWCKRCGRRENAKDGGTNVKEGGAYTKDGMKACINAGGLN